MRTETATLKIRSKRNPPVKPRQALPKTTRTYFINFFDMQKVSVCRAPGLVDRVFAFHADSRGFDSHRRHIFERFFLSNRPGYPHPVHSELRKVVSERRSVIAVSLTVSGGVHLIKPTKLYMCTQNTTNTVVMCLI